MGETIKIVVGENEIDVSPWAVARSLTAKSMAELLDDYCNVGMKDYHQGVKIGENARSCHRTIQGSIVRLCIGIIVGLSEQEYTDARNEMPVACGKEIKKMLEDGRLKMGWMI